MRCAELRVKGEHAMPYLRSKRRVDGGVTYSVFVRRADGTIEDVVEKLRVKDQGEGE